MPACFCLPVVPCDPCLPDLEWSSGLPPPRLTAIRFDCDTLPDACRFPGFLSFVQTEPIDFPNALFVVIDPWLAQSTRNDEANPFYSFDKDKYLGRKLRKSTAPLTAFVFV